MSSKKPDDSRSERTPISYFAIRRRWLIVLMAFFLLPWIAVAALWLKPNNLPALDAVNNPPATKARAGKWGELTLVPIVIAPPMELVFIDWGFNHRPTWYFPGANADMVGQLLQWAGISAADIARMRTQLQPEPQIQGLVLSPDPDWVRTLSPEVRARLYHRLAKSKLNVDQTLAFRYRGSSPDEWFGSSTISPQTRQLIEPLIYRDGNYMLFSDIELVRERIGSDDEMRRLGKALFQQPTVIARLAIDRMANLDTLIEYWGRGGRRTEIRPLLESVAGGGSDRFIDVFHLLPPFARDRLYCYPELSAMELDRPAIVNCLWTSLNFFLPKPDDRFLNDAVALKTLKEDYFIVEADFELGDIVAFLDEQGNLFHAAVYIADDILFSKNGISAMTPWTLMSIEDVKGYYRWLSENPRMLVHRRKNI